MHQKKSLVLTVLAVFSIVILLAQNNIDKVYALSKVTVVTGASNVCHYDSLNALFLCIDSATNQATHTLRKINAHTGILLASYTIKGLHGNVVSPLTLDSGFNGLINSIWCDGSFCYWDWENGGSVSSQIQKWSYTGSQSSYLNYSSSSAVSNFAITGYGTTGTTSFATIFITRCTTCATHTLVTLGGGNAGLGIPIQETSAFSTTLAGGSGGAVSIAVCQNCGGTGATRVAIALAASNPTGWFSIWNPVALTNICQGTLGALSHASARGISYDSTNNKWYVPSDTNIVNIVNADTCNAVATTVSSANLGSSNFIKGIAMNIGKNEYYVYSGSSSSQGIISVMNFTSPTSKLSFINTDGAGMTQGSLLANTVDHAVLANDNTANTQIYYFDIASGGTSGRVCIDTNLDGQITGVDVCFNDTNGDGLADSGVAGLLDSFRMNENATTIGFKWNCALGIGSCTDQNPKTNGVGLIYYLLIIIFSYMFLVLIHVSAIRMINKQNVQVMEYLHIHPILLLVMLIVDTGITWQLQWLPDLVFYTIIVVLGAGLTGFAFYSKMKSGND